MNSGMTTDPEVSVAMAEYVLIVETGLRPQDLDTLPARRVAVYIAIAYHHVRQRKKEIERAQRQVHGSAG